jgi:phage terminase small subunit
MNARQTLFVAEYLKDQNAKQAAIRAGYSAVSAEVNGPRLLGNAEVRAAIDAGLAKLTSKAELTAEWVLNRLQEEAVVGDETTPASRVKALELCGRYLALWEDRLHLTGKIETAPTLPVSTLTDEQLRTIQKALTPLVADTPAEPRPQPAS